MAPSKRNIGKKLLSSTRPSISSRVEKPMSSKATRTIIRSHHVLQKQLKQAETSKDETKAAAFRAQIEALGGLHMYQKASIQGQSADRGGDSSRVLVDWWRELGFQPHGDQARLRLLEVGSLKVDNYCARSGLFEMVRIDLNSQHPDILEQDFMQRPVPKGDGALADSGFDIISLSLVVNYVPEAEDRGQMLKRTTAFLRQSRNADHHIPGLFLVLPAPCVLNSRYMDDKALLAIMEGLGYTLLKSKVTAKLVYYYYKWSRKFTSKQDTSQFAKRELHQGRNRNNFAIVLK